MKMRVGLTCVTCWSVYVHKLQNVPNRALSVIWIEVSMGWSVWQRKQQYIYEGLNSCDSNFEVYLSQIWCMCIKL